MVPSEGRIGYSNGYSYFNGELNYLVTSNIVVPNADRLLLE
eukprot:gene26793-33429_t